MSFTYSYFQVHNSVSLTVGTTLYSRFLEFTHLAQLKLYTNRKTIPCSSGGTRQKVLAIVKCERESEKQQDEFFSMT